MKTKCLALLLLCLPLVLGAQNYEQQGDELFAQAQYEKAVKKYKAAEAVAEMNGLVISQQLREKKDKTLKCIDLLGKANSAEDNQQYEEAESLYSELYALHPLPSYLSKAKKAAFRKAHANTEEEDTEGDDDVVFVVVETMPEFPGGQQALFKYLSENVKCPAVAQRKGIQGRVICQFVVNKDGSIVNVEVVRSGGDASLDKEAVRVIKSMPKWKPGKQRGKVVRVKYTLTVNFSIADGHTAVGS